MRTICTDVITDTATLQDTKIEDEATLQEVKTEDATVVRDAKIENVSGIREASLGKRVREIYADETAERIPLKREHALLACLFVHSFHPPGDEEDALRMLVCLNLLNAYVKLPEGVEVVSYGFIKGYVGLLFRHITENERDFGGVAVYYDRAEDVVYFRLRGVQLSFHRALFSRKYRSRLQWQRGPMQHWDGMRLQNIAEELFELVCPDLAMRSVEIPESVRSEFLKTPEWEEPALLPWSRRGVMRTGAQRVGGVMKTGEKRAGDEMKAGVQRTGGVCMGKVIPNGKEQEGAESRERESREAVRGWGFGLRTLRHALQFNIWFTRCFSLCRIEDGSCVRVIYYDGSNAKQVNDYLRQDAPWVRARKAYTLVPNRHYYVTPQLRIRLVSPSRYHRLLAQNHYHLRGGLCRNLCITYGIALYLSERFPSLLFLNTMNCNREQVRTIFYNRAKLLRVPPESPKRKLCSWLVMDKKQELRGFDVREIPVSLFWEYLSSPEAESDFQVEYGSRGCGIKAYNRFHLLPCDFRSIRLVHNYAYVERQDGKIAVYALRDEVYRSGFVYDRLEYDAKHFTKYGVRGEEREVIFQLKP